MEKGKRTRHREEKCNRIVKVTPSNMPITLEYVMEGIVKN